MSETVIKVENLSKKYIISHQQKERYIALRDVMARGMKNFSKKLLSPFNSHPSPSNDTTEEFYALKDINFEIKQGERVGIIGRNGAGKTTLLKILSRITEPTTGEIEITGRVASLLEVGTGFHPELTGRENIFLNGAILGMTKVEIKKKFDEIVAFAEIEKFLDTPVKRYSSGMYVRLAFAVAAHLEPEILLVDEVLAVGDAAFQKKCLGKMGEVSKEGRTILFVSHNMIAIRGLTTRVILLDKGCKKADGPPDDVIEKYLTPGNTKFTYDIEREPREYHTTNKVRLTRIELVGHMEGRLAFCSDLQILLTMNSWFSQSGLRISYTIFTATGIPIGSGISQPHLSVRLGETARYHFRLPSLSLAPGRYFCGFGVVSRDYSAQVVPHDVYIGAPHFEVFPRAQDGLVINTWGYGWGNIVLPSAVLTEMR